jgi:tetratricopeptide (TPR) repeat protein
VRLAGALLGFWQMRGRLSEGRACLAATLARVPAFGSASCAARVKALNAAGWLAFTQGDFTAARSVYEEGLALARRLRDKPSAVQSLYSLGRAATHQQDNPLAIQLFAESLALAREEGDAVGIARSLFLLGEMEETTFIAWGLHTLAADLWAQDDYLRALALYQASLPLHWSMGAKGGIARCIEGLAWAAGQAMPLEQAIDLPHSKAKYQNGPAATMGSPLTIRSVHS